MLSEDSRRKRGRDDLTRVIAKQEVKDGAAIPNMRAAEAKARERAEKIDKAKDRGIKGDYRGE